MIVWDTLGLASIAAIGLGEVALLITSGEQRTRRWAWGTGLFAGGLAAALFYILTAA